jgi:hypothetical protein
MVGGKIGPGGFQVDDKVDSGGLLPNEWSDCSARPSDPLCGYGIGIASGVYHCEIGEEIVGTG